jgi:uncharacterized membrane protein YdjX (TVP38/TMEM64 family)
MAEPLPTEKTRIWRRAVALVLLCVALAAVASSEALHSALLSVLDASEQIIRVHPVLGATLFVLFAAVSALIAFVSVAVIVPVAVYTWGQATSILLLWFGWMLGGVFAYGIARLLGRTVVRWLTAEAGLKRLESRISRSTPFSLVLLLQLALPSEIPGYLLGLVRYPLFRYLAALALAELPYAIATVLLGASFLERRSYLLLALGLVLVAGSLFAFQRLRGRLRIDA